MHATEITAPIAALARPEALQLPRYETGPPLASADGRGESRRLIRLATNESPVGPSPAVLRALQEASSAVSLYPDPASVALRAEISSRAGVSPDRIAIGNGSENVIEMICQVFLRPQDAVATSCPSFALHVIYPLMMGARVHSVRMDEALQFDLDAWRRVLSTAPKLVMLSNPSNPAGSILKKAELDAFLHAMSPQTLLVLDEAYHEYAQPAPEYPDGLRSLTARRGPWVVLRTFSKAHGLAGLRVGYAIASDAALIDLLDRVRTPYNVNGLAQAAAIASLRDPRHVATGVSLVAAERLRLERELRSDGFLTAPSEANFLFIDARADSLDVARRLQAKGVLVKPWREPGFERFIRATIGTAEDNDLFLAALRT